MLTEKYGCFNTPMYDFIHECWLHFTLIRTSSLGKVFAIGPADGFSSPSRDAAQQVLSLGKMTLAHELARVVWLEQIYRAFTILKGHPYHTGH